MSVRLRPHFPLAVLVFGTGLGFGLGLAEAPETAALAREQHQPAHNPSHATRSLLPPFAMPAGSSTTTTQPQPVLPRPSASPTAPLCLESELSAAAVSYGNAGTVLSVLFYITDTSASPCAIPAAASLSILDAQGFPVASSSGGAAPQSGYFTLHPDALKSAYVITEIENWCGSPAPATQAILTLASVGRLPVPIISNAIGQGIACENPSDPPGVESPVQVDLVPNGPMLVPIVVGETLMQARSTLENLGFQVAAELGGSLTASEGLVAAEKPNAGAYVEPGSMVTLTVSTGPGDWPQSAE